MKFPSLQWADIVKAIKNYFNFNKSERKSAELAEREKARKLLDYYSGNQEKDLIGLGFEDATSGKELIPKMTLNITKKIIDKVSMVYKYPPKRTLVNDEGEEIDEGSSYAKWVEYVETFDNNITEAERQKNLFHKVLWRTQFNPVMQKWQWFIEWDYKPHFIDGDPLNPIGYSIPVIIHGDNLHSEDRISSDDQIYLYYDDMNYLYYNTKGSVWTYYVDYNGNEVDLNGKNPYGVSPFVELRKTIPVYEYGTLGAVDLVSANKSINQNLNNLNMALHYQGFGIIWDNSGLGKEAGTEILIGPNRQVHVDSEVSINNLDLNPKLLEMIDTIKFEVQAISNTYNLTVNWHQEATPVSGFSLIVQNMDYIEQRQKDVDQAKMQENKIFRSIKAMQDYHSGDLDKDEPKIADGNLTIDFQELDLPINQVEELSMRRANIEDNIKTPVDYIMADNPDMDFDTALEKFKENQKINGNLSAVDQVRDNLESQGVVIEPNE